MAIVLGWINASKWGLRAFMALWTGVTVFALLNYVASEVIGKLDQSTLDALFGPPSY